MVSYGPLWEISLELTDPQVRRALTYVSLPLYFLLAATLWRRGLVRSYPFFTVYLCLEGTALCASLLAAGSRKGAVTVYLVAQPLLCLLYFLMVTEVYTKVFARFPGIARFGRRVLLLSMAVAILIAIVTSGVDNPSEWSQVSTIRLYSSVQRALTTALSLFMILIAGFLIWMPVPLPANTLRHGFLFFFYFLTATSVYFYLNTIGTAAAVPLANLVLIASTILALTGWLVLLKANGEEPPAQGSGPKAPASQILGKLEELNRNLSRNDREI